LDEHASLLNEAKRVLKKGGRLYMFEHNPYNPGTQYLVKTCAFDGNAHLLTASHFKRLFRQGGFAINFINYIVFLPGWKWLKPFHALEKYFSWLPLGGQYFFGVTKK